MFDELLLLNLVIKSVGYFYTSSVDWHYIKKMLIYIRLKSNFCLYTNFEMNVFVNEFVNFLELVNNRKSRNTFIHRTVNHPSCHVFHFNLIKIFFFLVVCNTQLINSVNLKKNRHKYFKQKISLI